MRTIIIPDLHGHFYNFINLLKKLNLIENNKIKLKKTEKIVLLGDLIDKGPIEEQKLLIEFIYNNLESLIIIKGNHEENVINFLKNNSSSEDKHDFFNIVLKKYPELEYKFLKIYEKSVLYFEDDLFFCNHSPCLKEHVENKESQLIKYSFKHCNEFESVESYEKYLKWHFCNILEEQIEKIHVFGHIGLSKPMLFKNQIWLDTAELNSLTVLVHENSDFYFINEKFILDEVFLIEELKEAVELIFEEWKKINKI